MAEGKDPAIEKKLAQINTETQSRTTFRLIAEEYTDNMEEWGRAPATMIKKRWILLDLSAPLHKRPINEITSDEVLYLLRSIEKSGRRETAKKMRSEISAVFRLAVVTLRAESDPTLLLMQECRLDLLDDPALLWRVQHFILNPAFDAPIVSSGSTSKNQRQSQKKPVCGSIDSLVLRAPLRV